MKEQQDQSFAYSNEDSIPAIKMILKIIPIAAVLIAASNIFLERYPIVFVVLTIPIFSFIGYRLLLKGRIRLVIYSMIVLISATITAAGFLGNGIHETAIIAFPVIVLLSTFVVNGKGVFVSSSIVIFCLALMSFGEMYGLFPTRPLPSGSSIDIIAISVILFVDIILIYSLTSTTKKSLQKAIEEVEAQRVIQTRIEKNLELKTELLREVHHRVKNNLSLINSLVDLEIMGAQDDKKDLHLLQRRIQAIARVHDPLFQSSDYKEVDIKEYLEKLIIGFGSALKIPDRLLKMEIENKLLDIDRAIPLGIILHELMTGLNLQLNAELAVRLSFKNEKAFFSFDSGSGDIKGKSKNEIDLVKSMSKELGGSLTISQKGAELVFDLSSENLSGKKRNA